MSINISICLLLLYNSLFLIIGKIILIERIDVQSIVDLAFLNVKDSKDKPFLDKRNQLALQQGGLYFINTAILKNIWSSEQQNKCILEDLFLQNIDLDQDEIVEYKTMQFSYWSKIHSTRELTAEEWQDPIHIVSFITTHPGIDKTSLLRKFLGLDLPEDQLLPDVDIDSLYFYINLSSYEDWLQILDSNITEFNARKQDEIVIFSSFDEMFATRDLSLIKSDFNIKSHDRDCQGFCHKNMILYIQFLIKKFFSNDMFVAIMEKVRLQVHERFSHEESAQYFKEFIPFHAVVYKYSRDNGEEYLSKIKSFNSAYIDCIEKIRNYETVEKIKSIVEEYTKFVNGEKSNCSTYRSNSIKAGYFTWLRHGRQGIKRASDFLSKIEAACSDEIMQLIQDEIAKGPHHNHSFSSYLKDEFPFANNEQALQQSSPLRRQNG